MEKKAKLPGYIRGVLQKARLGGEISPAVAPYIEKFLGGRGLSKAHATYRAAPAGSALSKALGRDYVGARKSSLMERSFGAKAMIKKKLASVTYTAMFDELAKITDSSAHIPD